MIGFFGYFSTRGENQDQKFYSMEKSLAYHGDRFNRTFIAGPGYKFCLRRHIKGTQGFAYSDNDFDVLVDGSSWAWGMNETWEKNKQFKNCYDYIEKKELRSLTK